MSDIYIYSLEQAAGALYEVLLEENVKTLLPVVGEGVQWVVEIIDFQLLMLDLREKVTEMARMTGVRSTPMMN